MCKVLRATLLPISPHCTNIFTKELILFCVAFSENFEEHVAKHHRLMTTVQNSTDILGQSHSNNATPYLPPRVCRKHRMVVGEVQAISEQDSLRYTIPKGESNL